MKRSRKRSTIRFGVFEAHLETGELFRHGRRVPLQEKPFQVLAALLERPRELVSREELQRRLWPADTVVEFDTNLNAAVRKLRGALRDSAETPCFVETVPRRGYRFIAPVVHPTTPTERAARWLWAPISILMLVGLGSLAVWGFSDRSRSITTARPNRLAIAVLPFANLSGEPAKAYYADGMTETLIADLAKIRSFAVISRTSVYQYRESALPLPEIARQLGADVVVEGAVTVAGETMRVNAQLIEAAGDRHLWAETYDRGLGDLLTLQSEIARAIAHEVRAELSPDEERRLRSSRSRDPTALDHYLRGLHHLTLGIDLASDGEKLAAIDQFDAAIAIEPDWADPHAGKARALHFMNRFEPAKESAARALGLDPSHALAHESMGYILMHEWDWEGAEREYRRAVELDPNSSRWGLAIYTLAAGHYETAIELFQQTRAIYPRTPWLQTQLVRAYACAGREEEAVQEAKSVAALYPDRDLIGHFALATAYGVSGKWELAIGPLEALTRNIYEPIWMAALAQVYLNTGRQDEARAILAQLEESGANYYPQLAVAAGNKSLAIEQLRAAIARHDPELLGIRCTVGYERLAKEPEIQELLAQIGFPES